MEHSKSEVVLVHGVAMTHCLRRPKIKTRFLSVEGFCIYPKVCCYSLRLITTGVRHCHVNLRCECMVHSCICQFLATYTMYVCMCTLCVVQWRVSWWSAQYTRKIFATLSWTYIHTFQGCTNTFTISPDRAAPLFTDSCAHIEPPNLLQT